MLTVGVPREIKPLEKRVGLTPAAVEGLTRLEIPVLVEKGAGKNSGFSDEDYQKKGAQIVPGAAALYAKAGLIQKVKEPLPQEYPLLRKGQILFCFLHLASPENKELVKALLRSEVLSIGYETVEVNGRLPLLAPMSEIAGALAAAYGGYFATNVRRSKSGELIAPKNRLGELEAIAAAYPHFSSTEEMGEVVIFGGGVAGQKAIEISLKAGAEVTVIEKNPERSAALEQKFEKEIPECRERLLFLTPEEMTAQGLEQAEILIGCVHSKGVRAFEVISSEALQKISAKKKKVILDVSIDQGGNFPESRPTTYENPIFLDASGNIRFCVANIPSLCGRGASEALSAASSPYTISLAQNPKPSFEKLPELARAINTQAGEIKLAAIQAAH